MNIKEIAKKYGVTFQTVYAWKKHEKKKRLFKAMCLKETVDNSDMDNLKKMFEYVYFKLKFEFDKLCKNKKDITYILNNLEEIKSFLEKIDKFRDKKLSIVTFECDGKKIKVKREDTGITDEEL